MSKDKKKDLLNSKIALKRAKKYFKKDARKLFEEHINLFYNYSDDNFFNRYEVGTALKMDENFLIHGSRVDIEGLESIVKYGLVAPEFLKKGVNKKKKKPFVVEFFRVDENITLKEFLNKYCGVTVEVKDNEGNITQNIITSFSKLEKEILKLEDYRDYLIYQNQEQRYLPNKYNKNSTMAFIIKNDVYKDVLIKNDIFSGNIDEKIVSKIVPKCFYEKYVVNKDFDNYETGREKAIIFGVPSLFIEGVIVGEEYEKDEEILVRIKELLPSCYICNVEGKIIA